MAAAALRPAILRRIRLSPSPSFSQPFAAAAAAAASHPHALARWLSRPMSSHDAHLTREEVVDRVLDVLKSHPKVDLSKVNPDAHFEKDLGLDSLDTVEVVMAIEEEFKLEIPDREADKIDSLPLAIEYVSNHPMAA
ncbi:hypothetical protein PR202_ga27943 [Eleusine coracana subsp. coracana]|uniref:Acyl carrier protein n=1 Tax=Eleusine coracana subsp. coracana TaxID=191504 RepID=A0AAV5DGI0_ELECO|nr:hypothetical protein PR202_ga27943 [Eleusine coracana subsp. coracana]